MEVINLKYLYLNNPIKVDKILMNLDRQQLVKLYKELIYSREYISKRLTKEDIINRIVRQLESSPINIWE